MIPIDNTLVSFDVIEKKFFCDLENCKGSCCVKGDSGAPVSDDEEKELKTIFTTLKPHMKEESIKRVEEKGISFVDQENELVTMIHENSGECVFAIQENGISKCVIEKLYFEGEIRFRKPVSCHLYPVRVKEYPGFTAVNYDEWDICKPALINGEQQRVPLYKFVKEALIRKFGDHWYNQLEVAAKEFVINDEMDKI